MKLNTIILLFASILMSTAIYARTWTDTKNRTMEAELVRVEGGEAVFQKPSGMRYRFPLANLNKADQDYIKENHLTEAPVASSQPTSLPETELTGWLEKRLVARDGRRVKRARESALPQAEYIAFYFSASWCPPCRTFTPKLVDFYNEHRKAHDNFEIVFVSSDRNEDDREDYMVDYEMPWPAVDFDDAKDDTVRNFSGKGIPCLVLVDRKGTVIEHSYVNGKYMGPTRVMNKLGELLAQ
jgi:nucleoredoxin